MSQEEVNQGCKGSIKVSALEIMGKSVKKSPFNSLKFLRGVLLIRGLFLAIFT